MVSFQFSNLGEFLEMGRHGFYVWTAYAVFIAIIVFNIASPWLRRRRFITQHQRRVRREKIQHESQT